MAADTLNLPPLKVTCTSSDCGADLHCFKFHSRRMKPSEKGNCRSCGIALVDWDRVHEQDFDDAENTFFELKREFIRHHFWHKDIDDKAVRHAKRKGRINLIEAAKKRLITSVGDADPFRDGRQTPMFGNILYYAQHATACCCRTCMEYWHGIPKIRPLSDAEIEYFAGLMMKFVDERMPSLADEPTKVPRQPRDWTPT